MTKTITQAPFRADHVGSLLRPSRLHEARSDFKKEVFQLNNYAMWKMKRLNESLTSKSMPVYKL